ncbi:MAG: hypothetical protein RLZZ15_2141 [Verrucomicrobiota bacterium]|jgi:hypothetical protein
MDHVATAILVGLAYAAHGAVVGLALLAAVRRRDWWPFSHYPMFAGRAEARAVRFFGVRFRLRDGRQRGLTGLADALADPFQRRCVIFWPEEGAPDLNSARTALLALWREAGALVPELREASAVEIVQRTARVATSGEIRQEEAIVLTLDLAAEAQR